MHRDAPYMQLLRIEMNMEIVGYSDRPTNCKSTMRILSRNPVLGGQGPCAILPLISTLSKTRQKGIHNPLHIIVYREHISNVESECSKTYGVSYRHARMSPKTPFLPEGSSGDTYQIAESPYQHSRVTPKSCELVAFDLQLSDLLVMKYLSWQLLR